MSAFSTKTKIVRRITIAFFWSARFYYSGYFLKKISSDHRTHPVCTTFCALLPKVLSTWFWTHPKPLKNHSKAGGPPFSHFWELWDLPETSKKFGKIFPRFLVFWEVLCLQLSEKWFSSLMRIPCGIIWHCRMDEFLTKVYLCICKKLYFFEPWAGRRLGPFPACFRLCETFSKNF